MSGSNMKSYVVSTADFAFSQDDMWILRGTTNLNTSIEVSMQEQKVNAGKGNALVFSYKYGRELAITIETAEWNLAYLAANTGSKITEGLHDILAIGECVTLTEGIGTLKREPVGAITVELPNGTILSVESQNLVIDLTKQGLTNESVRVTYVYNRGTRRISIGDGTPLVGKLVLDADKYNDKKGKVGTIQITVPSYQLNGNFSVNFTPDGVTSTNLDGQALAVAGDSCSDGGNVYAYVDDFDLLETALTVSDICVTPGKLELAVGDKTPLSVLGLKGGLFENIELDNTECVFTSDDPAVATVSNGEVTGVASGNTNINVVYDGFSDTVDVIVS